MHNTTLNVSECAKNSPILLKILVPEPITMADPHELIVKNFGKELARSKIGSGLSQTARPDVTLGYVILVHLPQPLNVPSNLHSQVAQNEGGPGWGSYHSVSRIHTIVRIELFKTREGGQSIRYTGCVVIRQAVIPRSLYVDGHQFSSAEVKWAKHLQEQHKQQHLTQTTTLLAHT